MTDVFGFLILALIVAFGGAVAICGIAFILLCIYGLIVLPYVMMRFEKNS